eukprot:3936231-Rhodomonas_salina.1
MALRISYTIPGTEIGYHPTRKELTAAQFVGLSLQIAREGWGRGGGGGRSRGGYATRGAVLR